MDVYETPEAFVLLAEIPGMAVKDLDIVVDRYHLKVSGCRKQPALSVSMVIHQAEIAYGSFERAFKLPGAIQPEKADATMDNGFLRVLLPKESPNAARIAVK
ncbi:MAG: Hsp20/alpha crystallin family protein [Proteobacteria bacterium]|nr:Hsp20/alpha crystallin family protein [Pseudomonadota bacterium]